MRLGRVVTYIMEGCARRVRCKYSCTSTTPPLVTWAPSMETVQFLPNYLFLGKKKNYESSQCWKSVQTVSKGAVGVEAARLNLDQVNRNSGGASMTRRCWWCNAKLTFPNKDPLLCQHFHASQCQYGGDADFFYSVVVVTARKGFLSPFPLSACSTLIKRFTSFMFRDAKRSAVL